MANIGVSAIKLIDKDGDPLDDGSGKLNVNATIQAGDLNVGNVDIQLAGTAVSGNSGSLDAGTIRVTLASNDPLISSLYNTEDVAHSSGHAGIMALAVRNDNAATTLSGLDGDYTPLAVNATGQLHVTDVYNSLTPKANATVWSSGHYGISALAVRNDTLAVLTNVDDGEYSSLQVSAEGALYTTHGITGGADGVTTDDTSGQALGGDVACKKVDIQAQTDNTGVIAVGFTGVDATVATGTGILLYAGDVYSLEINNLNLIYIESSESGEGVRYTYFT